MANFGHNFFFVQVFSVITFHFIALPQPLLMHFLLSLMLYFYCNSCVFLCSVLFMKHHGSGEMLFNKIESVFQWETERPGFTVIYATMNSPLNQ